MLTCGGRAGSRRVCVTATWPSSACTTPSRPSHDTSEVRLSYKNQDGPPLPLCERVANRSVHIPHCTPSLPALSRDSPHILTLPLLFAESPPGAPFLRGLVRGLLEAFKWCHERGVVLKTIDPNMMYLDRYGLDMGLSYSSSRGTGSERTPAIGILSRAECSVRLLRVPSLCT